MYHYNFLKSIKITPKWFETVTPASGFLVDAEELKKLATQLKRRCGTGGSVKDGVIIIQGSHRDTLITKRHRGLHSSPYVKNEDAVLDFFWNYIIHHSEHPEKMKSRFYTRTIRVIDICKQNILT